MIHKIVGWRPSGTWEVREGFLKEVEFKDGYDLGRYESWGGGVPGIPDGDQEKPRPGPFPGSGTWGPGGRAGLAWVFSASVGGRFCFWLLADIKHS